MRYAIALALVLLPCAAQAAPVYLKCHLAASSEGGTDLALAPMDVTLNENEGTASYSFPALGLAYTVHAMFTADSVQFNGFSVDRTNFAFQRHLGGSVDHGICALSEVRRAF